MRCLYTCVGCLLLIDLGAIGLITGLINSLIFYYPTWTFHAAYATPNCVPTSGQIHVGVCAFGSHE